MMTNDINWQDMFNKLYPDFFALPSIRSLPADGRWEEMVLPLDGYSEDAIKIDVPPGITFGFYDGGLEALRAVVARVDDGWPALYRPESRTFCAFDGDRIASFCMLEKMGEYQGLRVGGPGCVGTVPEYRKQGIGLRMVQLATGILAREGFDISYIHYTGVARWYARLGYRTIARWGREGVEK